MHISRQLLLAAAVAAFPGSLAFAQQARGAQVAASASTMAEGEVRQVHKAQKKITLRHGEIKELDMPPMTMVFAVEDASLLDQVKPGDKVRFRAASQGGKLTVTEMQRVD